MIPMAEESEVETRLVGVVRGLSRAFGKSINRQTAMRWVHVGLLTPSGGRAKLATLKIGARYYTTHADITRFVQLCSGRVVSGDSPTP